jgi:hypothetical protein
MSVQKSTHAKPAQADNKVTVENINHPGYMHQVDAAMYQAMRQAMLKALPASAPGLTQDEIRQAVLPYLSVDLFPGGAKAGWWAKTVQLDLEAKRILIREKTKPLRWHRLD